jgi:hypothetical protein
MSWRTSLMPVFGATLLGALPLALACTSTSPATAPDGGSTTGTGATSSQTGKDGGTDGDAPSVPSDGTVVQTDALGQQDVMTISEDAACADTSEKARLSPVNMILIVDKSGSMGAEGQVGAQDWQVVRTQRWEPLKAALLAFFGNPGTTDIYASLDFFPALGGYNPDSTAIGPCNPTQYESPQLEVPLSSLNEPDSVDSFTDAINNPLLQPGGGTPTIAAIQGSLEYASTVAAKQTDPGAQTMVVLITDGEPGFAAADGSAIEGCTGNNTTQIIDVVADYFKASPSIKTYVFGVGIEVASMKAIAQAGGTVFKPIPVGDPTATQAKFLNELKTAQTRVFPCDYEVPEPDGGTIDRGFVNVEYIPQGTGTPEMLYFSANCSGTQAGWKYSTSGDKVQLCDATCNRLKADAAAQVNLRFGCKTIEVPQ